METVIVLALLGGATFYVLFRIVRGVKNLRSKNTGCGSCCGCSSKTNKLS
jgi:hypothetical protein